MYSFCICFIQVKKLSLTSVPNNQPARAYRRTVMSNYEIQIRKTGQFYDEAIRAAEGESIEILSSVVPGSRLHEIINNPVDSGIDEG